MFEGQNTAAPLIVTLEDFQTLCEGVIYSASTEPHVRSIDPFCGNESVLLVSSADRQREFRARHLPQVRAGNPRLDAARKTSVHDVQRRTLRWAESK